MVQHVAPDVFHRWIEPLGLAVMLVLAFLFALLVVRRHGHAEQRRLARAERKHPFAAPGRSLAAFGTAVAAAIVFARIAREVVEDETRDLDRTVSLAIHSLDGTTIDPVMRAFTFLGSPYVVVPLVVAVVAWALRRRDYRAALVLVAVVVMTEMLNVLLKHTFSRARPTLWEEIANLHSSYSFPSGHSMAAAASYGMMGIVISRLAPRHQRLLLVTLPALIFMIGLSRVFLGRHWPTDVVAGFAAGGFMLLAGAITLDGLPSISEQQRASH